MLKTYIHKVVEGLDLTEKEAEEAMGVIMAGEATDAQLACLVTALKMKGEKTAEIVGFARAMARKAEKVNCRKENLVDTCGTGGDGAETFNISTTAALIAAGCGLAIAKHGNRSVSSQCGSADVLEALGLKIDLSPRDVARCIEEVGLGFLFAPHFHKSMKHAVKPRKEIAIRTIFNLLGPLTNPAGTSRQLIGVYREDLTETLGDALLMLGMEHAWIVYGLDGIDELTVCAKTRIVEVKKGTKRAFTLDPEQLGVKIAARGSLKGGGARDNAAILLNILKGKENGPMKDAALLNAAAALVVGGLAKDIQAGFLLAEEAIKGGKALAVLEKLRVLTREAQAS